jgi:hypothetical protein
VLAGEGPRFVGRLRDAVQLTELRARRIGDDVLFEGYIREP